MGSKASRAKRPTPTIPHDIINEILDYLASDSDFQSLRACALVSKRWVQPCQRHLFHTICFNSTNARNWLKTFPAREESPAHHVRDFRLEIEEVTSFPDQFFECIPWFTDVDKMSLLGFKGNPLGTWLFPLLREPAHWKLPRSVTSLTINPRTGVVSLIQVRDIMAQLPNLDNLELSGYINVVDRRKPPGIGTALRARFGGRLKLRGVCVSEEVINMLLEIPSGLHFTELVICCTYNRLPSSAVRLTEACAKTLVKLSHTVDFWGKSHPLPSLVGSNAKYRC